MENKGQKPTVDVERRRPGSSTPPAQRERAEAPNRQRERGSSGGPSGGTPGGSLPPGMGNLLRSPLGIVIVILLVVCGLPIYLLLGGKLSLNGTDGTNYQEEEATRPIVIEDVRPTSTRRPTATPAPAGASSGQTWTVLLYQDADDKILEQDIFVDLNEAERVGSGPNLNVVAQIDRYQAGYQGDGDWTSARRYYVTQDQDLQRLNSPIVDEMGEVNMASGQTLVDFVTWAMQSYPADHHVLILSDHGMGWPGGWSDPTSPGRSGADMPLASVLGDMIYLNELDQALQTIRDQTGLDAFELVGMDACLMGHLEVLAMLTPHARYAVVSQETEPALGWAYASFLTQLNTNPSASGADLGSYIVNSYIQDDQRIVDDAARAEFAGRGSPLLSLFGMPMEAPSADQVARQLSQNVTLTAADLSEVPALVESLNTFAYSLQNIDQRLVAQARSYSQSYTSIFGREVPPSYIDLTNFAELISQNNSDNAVNQAISQMTAALGRVVVAEVHGPKVPGSNGISIYFPNSQLYGNANAGPQSYTVAANRFVAASLWDEFLLFHYTGRGFEMGSSEIAIPARSQDVQAPAAGGLTATPLRLSADSAAPGEPVLMSTDIQGENIGYIRLLVGYIDTASNSIYIIDSDYIQAGQTYEAGGMYYPDWGTGGFTMEFEWEPLVFTISDGANSSLVFLNPDSYGATPEEAVYTVEGIYTFADSSEQRNARLYFSNGWLQQIFGFTGEDANGAPREIIPTQGDSFTIMQQWMDLDAQGNVVDTVLVEGDTLTFGEQMFYWEQLYAPAGEYVIGFIIEDLDGASTAVYAQLTVR